MSDPLALLPLAIAAGGGRVDGLEAQQLVAAGLTLLRRGAGGPMLSRPCPSGR